MDIRHGLLVAAMTVAASAAFAQEQNSQTFGHMGPPVSKASLQNTNSSTLDKDGDGLVCKNELSPGSQLYSRFATRDSNGDGCLSKDEYWMP